MRVVFIFKGAHFGKLSASHEIVALSWFFFFCTERSRSIKGKEQKIKLEMNPSKNRKLQNSNLQITPQLLYLILKKFFKWNISQSKKGSYISR